MDRDLLADLVGTASTSRSADRGTLSRLVRSCWPGAADGTVPVAVPWLRRWGPSRAMARPPVCACPTGRCGSCN